MPCSTKESRATTISVPRQALPQGWNDYGLATLDLSWELDFWGKNRAALAAALSEQRAAEVEVAQARLILSTAVASEYAGLVHLYTLRDNAARDADSAHEDSGLVPPAARVRSRDLGQRASSRGAAGKRGWATCLVSMSASACNGMPLRRSWVRVRTGAWRSPVRPPGSPGPKACLRTCPWNSSGADLTSSRLALRTEAAARRIDQQKAGFYPSVNLMAFVGVQSLGIANSDQVGFQRRQRWSGGLAAHFQHRAAAGPIAGCPRRVRRRCRDLQRHAVKRLARSGRRGDEPKVPGRGACRLAGGGDCGRGSTSDGEQALPRCAGDLSRCAGCRRCPDLSPARRSRIGDARPDSRCSPGARTWRRLFF